jgi:hypothetical protein
VRLRIESILARPLEIRESTQCGRYDSILFPSLLWCRTVQDYNARVRSQTPAHWGSTVSQWQPYPTPCILYGSEGVGNHQTSTHHLR